MKTSRNPYSIKDHLGNVRVTFADVKIPANGQLLDFYTETQSVSTYYPFGWEIKPLSWAVETFAFGYQGQIKDDELKGKSVMLNYKYRAYDSRVARFFAVDPLAAKYPMYSSYHFSSNQPIHAPELEGMESKWDLNSSDPNLQSEGSSKAAFGAEKTIAKGVLELAKHAFGYYEATREGEEILNAKNPDGSIDWVTIANINHKRAKFDDLPIPGSSGKTKVSSKNKVQVNSKSFKTAKVGVQGIELCFVAGTKVFSDSGFVSIEDVKVESLVWTYDDILGVQALKPVSDIIKRTSNHLRVVVTEQDTIFTTNEHPFEVQGQWVKASDLKVGDSLSTYTGKVIVQSCFVIDTVVQVYNFTVDDFHSYYVSDSRILVHNGCGNVLRSVVKSDSKLLKYAQETFKGNSTLRAEANGLIKQMSQGNMNPGIGTKSIGNGILEARSKGGARVYFRNVDNGVEILGYSNKGNQQSVINRLKEVYGK